MSVWKLRAVMFTCFLGTIIVGSAILYGVTTYILKASITITAIAAFVTGLAIIQWLLAPKIIEAVYSVEEADPVRYGWLHEVVEELAEASGLKKKPKVMIAHIPIPNAFAYGSPITGPRVAVTDALLRILNKDELKAVLGHEIGHLRHRDVAWMLAISLLPMLIYYLGDILMRYGFFGSIFGGEAREGAPSWLILIAIGVALLVVAFILNLFVLAFSRFREYFADRHSVKLVPNGGKLLQRALAKIVLASKYNFDEQELARFSQFRALFIQDVTTKVKPHFRDVSSFIEYLKSKPLTLGEKIAELFSTHPNIKKRLIMLDKFNEEYWSKY
ncbi:MAG: zinc metalloprotease HtpX [Thermoprotei archaeon ex4572_64]|nr:MAG: zinc metalloprotease HtpX [Thermoprotei archaeon ex4572_64]